MNHLKEYLYHITVITTLVICAALTMYFIKQKEQEGKQIETKQIITEPLVINTKQNTNGTITICNTEGEQEIYGTIKIKNNGMNGEPIEIYLYTE